MCALILLHRIVPDYPVVLAANRDEEYARPAAKPALDREGAMPFVAPRDLRAGGTWIGTNAGGLTVAVTNRRDADANTPERRPSRGLLVRALLAFSGAEAATAHVERTVAAGTYAPFHLVLADARDAFAVRGGASATETFRLDPGVHVVTNLHELFELRPQTVLRLARDAAGAPLLDTIAALADLLRRREPIDGTDFTPCRHHGDRGTRSSTIVARGGGGGLFLHAEGPPDRTPFEDYGAELKRL